MVEGTVKFFNEMKQFGFIAGDDGKEYFVHVSGLKEGTKLREGDKLVLPRISIRLVISRFKISVL
jgi:CspA family cold shock protein